MIATNVLSQPEAPAICSWDGELSYAELDSISNSVASRLVSLGAGPGTVIPLCFEKSKFHPVAALAVMKAGAACVSIDTTQPEGRLRAILEQINPQFLLCSNANEQLARRLCSADVFVMDNDSGLQSHPGSPLPRVSPSDVLYVVFTSGSTGTPKGIVTTHENFASAALHQELPLHVKTGTRVFDFVSYSFDVPWSNSLNTLIRGGCLYIPSEWERRNDIAGGFNRMQADYSYFTPSIARSLEPSAMPGLKTLAMGGEPIRNEDVARWKHLGVVFGIYRPAECAQALTFIRLDEGSRNNHIGHSFGARMWLVKPDYPDQLAAIDTVGELLIEGSTAAQHHWNDLAKTEAAFLPSPSWLRRGAPGHPGRKSRVYKTGDLLRYNSDGSLDFRVELGEVEHHVRALISGQNLCEAVAAEIITPQNSSPPILGLFLSLPKSSTGENKREALHRLAKALEGLEEKLSERLPQYMIPGAYIPLEVIPMTTTNKTDRRALREIGSKQKLESLVNLQSQGNQRNAPSTKIEKQLQALWSSILGIEASSINADSSFLRIGGESIAAMRLVAAARDQQLSFTVADVFKHPRLHQLAKFVKELRKGERTGTSRTVFSVANES